ncbi:MAG: hypothetical protein ASARMPREDX12_001119 [Alectoria sarmentosa]|nr:MAG: hypothetical protein ASARMPREDX12_001119 [Alectoria sarmentosa]
MALDYRKRLQTLAPDVHFLMSLYLHPSITPEVVIEAKKAGIRVYPSGVTTNSSSGVQDLRVFYPVFREMMEQDLVLNLHGECPSRDDVTVLNAEERFLPTLLKLHHDFPRLRIVLEHCSTEAAVAAVFNAGETVVGSITPHHLSLIIDDWAGDSINYCKPVAKTPRDRMALLKAAASGDPKFFLGSDSAPHSIQAKQGGQDGKGKHAAGVWTQPFVLSYALDAFEQGCRMGLLDSGQLTKNTLAGFLGEHGRTFYKEASSEGRIIVGPSGSTQIPEVVESKDHSVKIIPFRRGQYTRCLDWM